MNKPSVPALARVTNNVQEMIGRDNLHKIVCENEYHVQEWYPLIEPLTFKSVFLELTVLEAKNFVRYTNLSVLDPSPNNPTKRKFVCSKEKELELMGAMRRLEEKIGMKQLGCTDGAFVRLSSRSPKDAVSSQLYDLYLHERTNLLKEGYSQNPVTDKIAFTRANVRVLRAKSGHEALLFMTNSNRVREDLQALCKLTQLSDSETLTNIVVRKWEEILPEYEFRAFVWNSKITAMTQYYKTTYVPQMVTLKQSLEERMLTFFEEHVKEKIPITEYVVDFAVDPTSNKIWVVEINNPPPVAGQALFNWDDETDKRIIQGASPFEFRILTTAPSNPLSDVQGFLDSERERREKAATKQQRRLSF